FEGEEVTKRAAVKHPRGPGGPVHDESPDLREIRSRYVDSRFDVDLVVVGRLDSGEIRKRRSTKLFEQASSRPGEPGVEVCGDLVLHELAAIIRPRKI